MNCLVLASASPRRYQLLTRLYQPFYVHAAAIDETPFPDEAPSNYVMRLAEEKAQAVLASFVPPQEQAKVWVLGADTIVVCEQDILEKPRHKADFMRMMRLLSGRSHWVMTAICLLTCEQNGNPNGQKKLMQRVDTKVNFRPLLASEMEAYWQTGEPHDKAGGYAIQGQAARFVTQLNGSYSAVVGLPLCETEALLQQAGFTCAFTHPAKQA